MGRPFHPDGEKSIDLNRGRANSFAAGAQEWQYGQHKPMFFHKFYFS